MPAGMAVLLLLGIIIAVVAYFITLGWRATAPAGMSRKVRAYIDEMESTLDTIQQLAYDNKDVEPGLADIIIDELKQHRARTKSGRLKELE